MGDAFAPWHIIILVVVLVVLFGAKRLPGAARSLGESMHIFKSSVSGGQDKYEQNSAANPSGQALGNALPPAFPAVAPPAAGPAQEATQQQLQDLQRQVSELQRQSGNGQGAETQTSQPL
jgi:sec-independent protein translocase protein TatA